MKNPPELQITKYMQNFHCIGPDCEDTCCKFWKIYVDKTNYKKVKKTFDNTAKNRDFFKNAMKRNRSQNKSDEAYALIKLREEDAHCPFFNEEKLCLIHSQFGEEYLCKTCRTYPRRLNVAVDRMELSGALSCPEIARLCLLHDDSTSLRTPEKLPVDPDTIAKNFISINKENPYVFYLNEMRSIFDQLLSLKTYPLDSRLFFISFLTNKLSPFFNSKGNFSEEQLAQVIGNVTEEDIIQQLHDRFQDLDASPNLPIKMINSMFQARHDTFFAHNLIKLLAFTYMSEEQASKLKDDNGTGNIVIDVENIYDQYKRRHTRLAELFGKRFDLIKTNLCKNEIASFLYTENDTITWSVQALLLKLSIVTILVASHSDLNKYIDGGITDNDQSEADEIFDRVVVDVVYQFSRALEHDKALWQKFHSITQESNLIGLALFTQFIQFSFAK